MCSGDIANHAAGFLECHSFSMVTARIKDEKPELVLDGTQVCRHTHSGRVILLRPSRTGQILAGRRKYSAARVPCPGCDSKVNCQPRCSHSKPPGHAGLVVIFIIVLRLHSKGRPLISRAGLLEMT